MTQKFELLLSPCTIGRMDVKNRIIMPAMGTRMAVDGGLVTEKHDDYYAARAKGGVGLIIVEAACIYPPLGYAGYGQLAVDEDRHIKGLASLAGAIKNNDSKAVLQIHHAGGNSMSAVHGGQPVAPSSVERGRETPRALSRDEVKEIIKRFIDGAVRAEKAGFDAVEIIASAGYLLAEFLTPMWNERQDEYGGSMENRARIVVEIIDGIRERLGDFPIICRINACEIGAETFGPDVRGLSLEEGRENARILEKAGTDAVDITWFGYGAYFIDHLPDTPGAVMPLVEGMKEVVSIPVIAVGGLNPDLGEKALRDGKADLVGFGRALIADPDIPNKLRDEELEEIRPCINCLKCVNIFEGISCSVNPLVGREREYEIKLAESRKKVIVVGGGPAGMEAAHAAALRGHSVSLFEAEPELGGQLIHASKPSAKYKISALREFLIKRLMKSGVKVNLGTRVNIDLLKGEKPDEVIIATGITPLVPQIKGIEKSRKVVSALDVLAEKVQVGKRVVIIGGELVGCETADWLSDNGREVTIVRRGQGLATKVEFLRKPGFLELPVVSRLEKKCVKFLPGVKYKEITEDGLAIIDSEGNEQLLEADTIVYASGALPDRELYESLGGEFEAKLAGDCDEPRNIREAIHGGFEAGFNI
ncbi:FAD-dependent oxidoreductase [Chloroflexota bacterium]